MEVFSKFSQEFLNSYKTKQVPWGFNGLGYIVYKRCVTIDTPILCADLTWQPAGELAVGTEIIGFEEGPMDRKTKLGRPRRIERSWITHNTIEDADCVEIELEDGTLLYSTPDHSWLAHTGWGIEWVQAKDLVHPNHLKPGEVIGYHLPKYSTVWSEDTSYEAGYLAAAFDGEGSLDRKRTLSFTQRDNEMLSTVCKYLEKYNFPYKIHKKSQSKNANGNSFKSNEPCYQISIYSNEHVMRFLGMFRPKRLLDKFIRSYDTMSLRRKDRGDLYKKVIKVTPCGKRKIAVISTSSKTHFTAGFPSHNTYARIKPDGLTEEWAETLQRCIEGAQKIGAQYTQSEAEQLFDLMYNLKCIYAGRMLWQLGTSTVDRFGGNSLLNCWLSRISKPEDFCFVFENLMLGGGVGFSIRREDVYEFPKVRKDIEVTLKNTKDADFIVPDSREGWIALLRMALDAFFETGKSFTYSTILIRPEGEPINGFGGTASGPKVLEKGIAEICKILKNREGKKIRSIDALDICNIIGSVVVAGNVRRSAEIALGDPDDILFLRAKRWDLGNIPNHRAMSNNTIYADDYTHVMEDVWDGYGGNGEPYGFFNLGLSQNFGRLGERKKDNAIGLNPCGEITLADKECCNLSEICLNNISSQEELFLCAKLLYKTQKAVCALPFIHSDTEKVVHKNFRIGIGITGICQSLDKLEWLDKTYKQIKSFDKHWSEQRGWPESIKLTTTKPSGTVSLLTGSTPGIHPAYSRYYVRRVRMSSTDTLVNKCRELGYEVEYAQNFDQSIDRGTVIVSFPCYVGESVVTAAEMDAIKQLELLKKIQTLWSDNAVSCTVYYRKEELDAIREWLRQNYKDSIKSVSFLLHQNHGFKQAPYEEITVDKYNEMISKLKATENINVLPTTLELNECSGGVCPIR